MESDMDESSDFREPVRPARKHKLLTSKKAKKSSRKVEKTKSGNDNLKLKNQDVRGESGNSAMNEVQDHSEEATTNSANPEKRNSEIDISHCPTCGMLFDITQMAEHRGACLRANFEACNVARMRSQRIEQRRQSITSGESCFCVICGTDLTSVDLEEKNRHMNRCIDASNLPSTSGSSKTVQQQSSLPEKALSKPVKDAKKSNPKKTDYNCVICFQTCRSASGLTRHMVKCQKKNNINTMTTLALHKPDINDGEFVDDDILERIRHVDSIEQQTVDELLPPPQRVKKKRAARKKKSPEAFGEEMLQIALRVSKGEDIAVKSSKSRKQNPKTIIPVMLELSPNSRRQQLEGRLHTILAPSDAAVEEIPCTPALPRSAIGIRIGQREIGDDQPCTSGTRLSQPVQSNPGNTDISDELQSPEVSSSTIKSIAETNAGLSSKLTMGASGSNKAVSNTQPNEKQSAVKNSNWSLAGGASQPGNYRAKNLLSQFEKSHETEQRNQANESADDSTPASVCDNENIDSTLAVIQHLERSPDADDSFLASQQVPVEEQLASSQRTESQRLHKLIDNSLYSDAKILVGSTRDKINLHRNILYCNSSLLLDEISEAESRNETLHLEEYAKSEVMPVICYVYSGVIDPLVNAAKRDSDSFAKIRELIKRFGVDISDTDQMILDSVAGETMLDSDEGLPKEMSMSENPVAEDTDKTDDPVSNDAAACDLAQEDSITQGQNSLIDNYTEEDCFSDGSDFDIFAYNAKTSLDNEDSSNSRQSELGECEGGENSAKRTADISFLHDYSGVDVLSSADSISSTPAKNGSRRIAPKKRKKSDFFSPKRKSRRVSVKKKKGNIGHHWRHKDCFCCMKLPTTSLQKKKDKETAVTVTPKKGGNSKRVDLRRELLLSRARECERHRKISESPYKKSYVPRVRSSSPRYSHSQPSPAPKRKMTPQKNDLENTQCTKIRVRDVSVTGQASMHKKRTRTPDTKVHAQRNIAEHVRKLKKRVRTPSTKLHSQCNITEHVQEHKKQHDRTPNIKAVDPSVSEQVQNRKDHVSTRSTKAHAPQNVTEHVKQHKKRVPSNKVRAQQCSPTIGYSERLPRFKERAGILKRPAVANMGKKTHRLSRSLTRTPQSTKKIVKSRSLSRLSRAQDNCTSNGPSESDNYPVKASRDSNHKEKSTVTEQDCNESDVITPRKEPEDYIAETPTTSKNLESSASDRRVSTANRQHRDGLNDDTVSPPSIVETQSRKSHDVCDIAERQCNAPPRKQYKFKTVRLSDYIASKSPACNREQSPPSDDTPCIDNDDLDDSFFDKFFSTPIREGTVSDETHESPSRDIVAEFAIPNADYKSYRDSEEVLYVGPVPITPMPDFRAMATPEVIRRATKIGLKKTLAKSKLTAKLEEMYQYNHQLAPGDESLVGVSSVDNVLAVDGELSVDDDFTDFEVAENSVQLSSMSAEVFVYKFTELPDDEINKLSVQALKTAHENGTLLEALQNVNGKIAHLKRGSRKELERCWNIVTRGTPEYDPKINAVCSMSQDTQHAISYPLSGYIAKHYLEYKLAQFECVPFLCDEMEKLYMERIAEREDSNA